MFYQMSYLSQVYFYAEISMLWVLAVYVCHDFSFPAVYLGCTAGEVFFKIIELLKPHKSGNLCAIIPTDAALHCRSYG